MSSLLRRIAGFALLPAMSMLASLVLLPLVAVNDGASGWSSVSLGQSVGALISVVGGLAWSVVGTQQIVEARNVVQRQRVFGLSLITRGTVIGFLSAVTTPIVWTLAPDGQSLSAVVFSLATAMNGLTASWYYAGIGSPRHLIINEGLTRTLGYIAAIPLVAWTGSTSSYAVCTLASGAVTVFLNYKTVFIGGGFPRLSGVEISGVFRSQMVGTASQVARSLHLYTPTVLLAAFVPAAVPLFTAINIVYKAGLNAVAFLPPALVQWMQPSGKVLERRRRVSLGICIGVALGIAVLWPLVGEWLLGYLYQGRLVGDGFWISLIGLGVGLSLAGFALQYLDSLPRNEEGVVFHVEMAVSLLGVLTVVPSSVWLGGGGAFATYLGASILKIVLLLLHRKRRPASGAM